MKKNSKAKTLPVLVAALAFGAAQAQEVPATDAPAAQATPAPPLPVIEAETAPATAPAVTNHSYLFVTGQFTKPDSGRDTQSQGSGLQAGFGYPLSKEGRWWLEGRFDYTTFETGAGKGTDFYQSSLGADIQYAFGNRVELTPFVLAGLGFAHDDVVPDSEDAFSLEAQLGAGLVRRIGNIPWLRGRADVRLVRDQFQGGYFDLRVHAGLEVALRRDPPAETREVVVEKVVIQEKIVAATDTDQDRVADEFDACPGTLAGVKVGANGCVVENQSVIVLRDVSFDHNSARLQLNGQRLLDDAVHFLNSQSELKAEIVGYADSTGPAGYNLKLSHARAVSAVNYLIGKGIAATRLTALGLGEAKPIASNETPEGREANRRVEFNLIVPSAPAAAP